MRDVGDDVGGAGVVNGDGAGGSSMMSAPNSLQVLQLLLGGLCGPGKSLHCRRVFGKWGGMKEVVQQLQHLQPRIAIASACGVRRRSAPLSACVERARTSHWVPNASGIRGAGVADRRARHLRHRARAARRSHLAVQRGEDLVLVVLE